MTCVAGVLGNEEGCWQRVGNAASGRAVAGERTGRGRPAATERDEEVDAGAELSRRRGEGGALVGEERHLRDVDV